MTVMAEIRMGAYATLGGGGHAQLTWDEYREAVSLAWQRRSESRRRMLDKGRVVSGEVGWIEGLRWDLTGACAERLAHKLLGVPWTGGTVNAEKNDPDLVCEGVPVQVRGSGWDKMPLPIRARDLGHLSHLFMLIVGDPPHQQLVGFISGWEAIELGDFGTLRQGGQLSCNVAHDRLTLGWDDAVHALESVYPLEEHDPLCPPRNERDWTAYCERRARQQGTVARTRPALVMS